MRAHDPFMSLRLRAASLLAALTVIVALLGLIPAAASATSVSSPAVSLTTSAAGVSHVTYLVTFTTSSTGGLPASTGTITVAAPTGTIFPDDNVRVTDLTAHSDLGWTSYPVLGNGGATATYIVGSAVPASHRIRMTILDVKNPAAGSYQLAVSTSKDTTAVKTAAYALTAPGSVTAPSIALGSSVAGATHVTYLVTFTTSVKGALAANAGTITLKAPAGTIVSDDSVALYDLTDQQSLGWTGYATLSDANATAVYALGNDAIPAGHRIRMSVKDVTNPAAGTTYQLSVSTSTDTVVAKTPAYVISAAPAVLSPTVSLTSTAAVASHITYLVSFTTSSKGALAADAGTITLAARTGTVFPSDSARIYDVTSSRWLGWTSYPTLSGGGAAATYTAGSNGVPASHRIRLTVTGVKNPAAGSGQLSISTSSDRTVAKTPAYTITAAAGVLAPATAFTTAAAGAGHVTYAVAFQTTATGALASDQGTFTLTAPTGTVFPSDQAALIYDVTTDTDLGYSSYPTRTAGGATATYTVGTSIPAGHLIEITIPGLKNPVAGSAYQFKVSTSSDTVLKATASYAIVAPVGVTSPVLTLTSTAASANHLTYTITFRTSAQGALSGSEGTITLAAPAGTVFAADEALRLHDVTDDLDLGYSGTPTRSNGNATATFTVNSGGIASGHMIEATVQDVKNPLAATGLQLAVSTSSDTVVSKTAAYAITAAKGVSAASVLVSNQAAHASADYRVTFTTSSTGALAGNQGTIRIVAPTGTDLGSQAPEVYDATTDTDLGYTSSPTTTGSTGTYTVGSAGIPAGHVLEVTIPGVVNPAAGTTYRLTLSTSSDTVAVQSATYTIG